MDDADRLLLFSSREQPSASTRWYAIGGGVEPGESLHDAAVREVREETGLADVTLSGEVWTGRPWLAFREGLTHEVRQHYFLARVPAFDIDTSAFEEFEKAMVTGQRWWTLDELRATTDVLRPVDLAGLLDQLLTEGPPPEPFVVDG